jgi:erythronate-4-phosphate dehydrogenase
VPIHLSLEKLVPVVPLRIVADENMPNLELFAQLGQVTRLPGRDISRQQLAEIDVLLVRSVTQVSAQLLAGTPVRFVGSATIGTDHIDLPWLAQSGIHFAHAPGCNAMAVAEYVLQAVLGWLLENGREAADISIGVMGCGNVGSQVAALFSAMGTQVRCCDPPRQQRGELAAEEWHSFQQVLQCDVVSLHVPLSLDGPDQTFHLLGAEQLAGMSSQQLLLNTCRGAVIDNQALLKVPAAKLPELVLDVWEGEPQVPAALFERVRCGTPHIAGYSVEGKLRGSWMVYDALAHWFSQSAPQSAPQPQASWYDGNIETLADVLALLQSRYAMLADHQRLEASLVAAQPAQEFDQLRKHYPARHELAGTVVRGSVAARWQALLSTLGVTASG